MSDLFGRYQSQETRTLARIDSTKYPDTNKDFEANLQRLNAHVDYISGYLQQMQKGLDQASRDPLTAIRDMVTDLVSLFAGGTLIGDINLGDLQYYLPALATMFGFNQDQPFPINLFYAAQNFFLGYIVPLDSFGYVIDDMIRSWASVLGLDESFIEAVSSVVFAIQSVTGNVLDLFNTIISFLDIFGVGDDGGGLWPLGMIWGAVTRLLGGLSLGIVGDVTDPVLGILAPWISEIAKLIDMLADIIRAFSGGLLDIKGVLNFASMFNGVINFMSSTFDPDDGWLSLIVNRFIPTGLLLGKDSPLNVRNLFGIIPQWLLPPTPISRLTADTLMLTPDPGFDLAPEWTTNPGAWFHDSTVGRENPGSAGIEGDGKDHELIGKPVPVTTNQEFKPTVYVHWEDAEITPGSEPVQLVVVEFWGTERVGETVIATVAPVGPSSWDTQLSGDYKVPIGVEAIALVPRVTSDLLGGRVWYDDYAPAAKGAILQEWVEGLPQALQSIIRFVQDVIDGIVEAIEGVISIGGATISDLVGAIGSLFNDAQDALGKATDALIDVSAFIAGLGGSIIGDAVDFVRGTVDGIVGGFLGWIGSGFGIGDAKDATKSAAETLAENSASIQELLRRASGASVSVYFPDYPNSNTLPSIFDTTLSGSNSATYGVENGRAKFRNISAPETRRRVVARYGVQGTNTDYQAIGAVWSSSPNPAGGSEPSAHNSLIGRMNAAGNRYVEARLYSGPGSGMARLISVDGDTETVLANVNHAFRPNTAYWLHCGTNEGLRHYRVFAGQALVLSYNDTAGITPVGESNRYVGLAARMKANAVLIFFTELLLPGDLYQFAFFDNEP